MREMFILMGEMVKSEVVKKAQQASFMGLLIDVMDIAQREQLVSFIRYVDQDTYEVKTDFLAVNDILESSTSANAETIKSVVVKQLSDCDLDINNNNINNNMFKQDDLFSYKNCYQYGSCINIKMNKKIKTLIIYETGIHYIIIINEKK